MHSLTEDNNGTYAQEVLDPIPEPIEKSELSIGFQEVVQIPNSGNNNNLSARLNLLADPGDDSGRLFVNDMRGKLYVISDDSASEYMDLASLVGEAFRDETNQQGFSYFAFHPEFATNGIFYTIHTEDKNTVIADFPITKPIIDKNGNIIESSHHSVVREWNATDPSTNTFSGTFRELLRIEQPYGDHDLGQLAFNPNANLGDSDYGMLYIAVSDGGSDGFPVSNTDPLNVGQDLNTILGSIVRIDPFGDNSANGQYGIPNDNPFVKDEDPNTLGEIWAYGLRNPHRFSWDTAGEGKMLISDIGQAFIEEVNLGIEGANYGWGEREGTWVVDENNENVLFKLPENDEDFGFTYPVAQYDHDIPPDVSGSFGIAIAGGFVYRGQAIPELQGHYIFADFGHDSRFFHVPVDDLIDGQQAKIQELRLFDGDEEVSFLEIIDKPRSDVRFGVDEEGEIYVTSKQDGKVRKIVPAKSQTNGDGDGDNDSIILPSAGNSVEKLVGDFDFIEGPVWHPDGFLLFSDIPGNTIYKLVPNEQPEVFRSPSGNANGNTFDLEGRLITAEHSNRRVSRTEHDGTVITIASEYEGKRLNSPNDLVVKSDGSIYFTDPPYGIQPKQEELGFYGVYRIAPDGTLTLLADDFVRPNGIAFSPDETKLYVNDSQTGNIRVFDVKPDGTLESGRIFAELKDSTKQGVPDGMKVDVQGNVYSTGPGGVWVFSPSGELLEVIEVPEVAANLTWGDNGNQTLYITATNSVYSIPIHIPDSENIDYEDIESNNSLTTIRVEAEDYSNYSDSTPGNRRGAYRNDDVDLQITTDIGGGFNVGWIEEGEWLTYDVNIPESGLYQISARVASNADESFHSLDVSIDGQSTSLNFNATGGWQSWIDVTGENLNLSAGNHELRFDMVSSSFNINYVDLIPV